MLYDSSVKYKEIYKHSPLFLREVLQKNKKILDKFTNT